MERLNERPRHLAIGLRCIHARSKLTGLPWTDEAAVPMRQGFGQTVGVALNAGVDSESMAPMRKR